MLRFFRRLQTPFSLVHRNIQSFSKVENIESLTIEPSTDLYTTYLKEEFSNLYSSGYQQRIEGSATSKGTKYYSIRSQIVDPAHFKTSYHDNLTVSSVGVGTYIGSPSELDDLKMFNGIVESVETGGVNIIDTAINYRYQKSERVVGAALRHLLKQGYAREEFVICSKNGYIPEDADKGISTDSIINKLIEKGQLTQEDIIKEKFSNTPIHCMHPAFLEDQLERSLTNIGVETLDLYYLHNPAESQLPHVGYEKFLERLAKAFEFCEKKAEQGKIKSYGLASWQCFRVKSNEANTYLRLQDVVEVAKKVAGDKHKFRYIQLPFNLIMPEAFLEQTQEFKEGDKTSKETLFQAAKSLKVNVITSSPLAQGLMMQVPLSTELFKASNLGAKHLQFARSVPAQALLSTVVGQKTSRHTKRNLEIMQYPPLNDEEWMEFFKPSVRRQKPEEAVEMDE